MDWTASLGHVFGLSIVSMKQLDIAPLERLQGFLEQVDCGDVVIRAILQAYSLRLQGLDKKLSKSLEEDVMASSSPQDLARSPVGPLSESGSRRILVSMILVLNSVYPDYDFTLLRASNFQRQPGLSVVEEAVDSAMVEVSKIWSETPGYGEEPFLDALWRVLDEACSLRDCEVFSYTDNDPFEEPGSLWVTNYFFVNRKEQQILFFAATGISKSALETSQTTLSYARYNDASDADSDECHRNDVVANSMANDMDDLE